MTTPKKPSMRDFDYFAEEAQPVRSLREQGLEDLPKGLEAQLQQFRRRAKRQRRAVFISAAFFVVACWFVWGFRDEMAFAFAKQRPAKDLGDVTSLSMHDLRHNDYVRIRGITEHRGLTQKLVRGVGLSRSEYWYMRLVGSGGIFVELPPDTERHGFATQVAVSGRVVDVQRDRVYRALVERYEERYFSKPHVQARVIQSGVAPGDGALAFGLMLALLGLLALANIVSLAKLWRVMRERPVVGG